MVSRVDPRNHAEVEVLLEKLPSVQYKPLVGTVDLTEIVKVFEGLPTLEFPINSAGELLEKLGGSNKILNIAEVNVNPLVMIRYMPAYYFPISSVENFIEKMGELIRSNRKQVDVPKELANIKQQLPTIRYPIASDRELLDVLGDKSYRFQGGMVKPAQIIDRIPSEFFPIQSEEDFDLKIAFLMRTRPLIVKD